MRELLDTLTVRSDPTAAPGIATAADVAAAATAAPPARVGLGGGLDKLGGLHSRCGNNRLCPPHARLRESLHVLLTEELGVLLQLGLVLPPGEGDLGAHERTGSTTSNPLGLALSLGLDAGTEAGSCSTLVRLLLELPGPGCGRLGAQFLGTLSRGIPLGSELAGTLQCGRTASSCLLATLSGTAGAVLGIDFTCASLVAALACGSLAVTLTAGLAPALLADGLDPPLSGLVLQLSGLVLFLAEFADALLVGTLDSGTVLGDALLVGALPALGRALLVGALTGLGEALLVGTLLLGFLLTAALPGLVGALLDRALLVSALLP